MDEELKQHLAAMENRLNERIERSETALLSAFHRWARSMEIRVRHSGNAVAGFDERLTLAEERISDLERGAGK